MSNYDVKKAFPALYAPKPGDFHVVEVPEMSFLMVDGHGDPNVAPAYVQGVQALFSLSYTIRAVAKRDLDRIHTVPPLEGLWSADDPEVFVSRDKSAWDWTMMVAQPEWISVEIVEQATTRLREAKRKTAPVGLERVRFAAYAEGLSVQILHLGSYDEEAPVLARLYDEYLPEHGLSLAGRHHEIYLSDPRRTEPGKLRTILRQPVTG